jgi:hypothetical protein
MDIPDRYQSVYLLRQRFYGWQATSPYRGLKSRQNETQLKGVTYSLLNVSFDHLDTRHLNHMKTALMLTSQHAM